MKKYLTLLMSTLMLLTSTGVVFADETENPNIKPTELSYEVQEGYEWSVPTKLEFTAENFADVVATDGSGDALKIAISKCVLTADKTLLIEVDAEQVFEIAESNGHTLDYAIKANDVSVGAGDVVLSLDSGEDCEEVETEIKGTLTKDANEIAGDYSGTLTFLAEIVRGGKAIKVVADGTTATNVRFTAMPTNKQEALKADLKLAGTSSLTDAELAAALVIDIDADTAGDVKMDISKLAKEGDKVLVYHKSSTNGWELLGEVEVGADGTVTCSFTDYSPILVSKKGESSQEQETLAPGLYVDGVMYKALTLDDCGTDAKKVKALITQTNTEVVLPKGVTSIGEQAFYDCSSLQSVIIPSSVTSIGNSAFSQCKNITSFDIPDSITSIGSYAFSGVPHIYYYGTATGAPWGAKLINDWYDENFAYADAAKTKIAKYIGTAPEVVIPNSVTSIGDSAFSGIAAYVSELQGTVTIPLSVTFEENSQLVTIGNSAFSQCKNITSFDIPDSVTSIGANAFYNIPLVLYGGTATGSPWGAKGVYGAIDENFGYLDTAKTKLAKYIGTATEVVIPSSVTSIEANAFRDCSGLTSVTFEENSQLVKINNSAFYNCTGLTSLIIPSSVTSIGMNAFYNVTKIYYSGNAQGSPWGAKNVAKYVVDDGNFGYLDTAKTKLAKYIGTATEVVIPNTVTSIEANAFKQCTNLTSVTFEENSQLVTIGNSAFLFCTGLTSLTVPGSVTSIGEGAFYACSGLTSLIIPNSVTSIGSQAFSNVPHIYYSGTATGSPWGAKAKN